MVPSFIVTNLVCRFFLIVVQHHFSAQRDAVARLERGVIGLHFCLLLLLEDDLLLDIVGKVILELELCKI